MNSITFESQMAMAGAMASIFCRGSVNESQKTEKKADKQVIVESTEADAGKITTKVEQTESKIEKIKPAAKTTISEEAKKRLAEFHKKHVEEAKHKRHLKIKEIPSEAKDVKIVKTLVKESEDDKTAQVDQTAQDDQTTQAIADPDTLKADAQGAEGDGDTTGDSTTDDGNADAGDVTTDGDGAAEGDDGEKDADEDKKEVTAHASAVKERLAALKEKLVAELNSEEGGAKLDTDGDADGVTDAGNATAGADGDEGKTEDGK